MGITGSKGKKIIELTQYESTGRHQMFQSSKKIHLKHNLRGLIDHLC